MSEVKDLKGKLRIVLDFDKFADQIQETNDIATLIGINDVKTELSRDEVWDTVSTNLIEAIGETAVAGYIVVMDTFGKQIAQTLLSASDMLVEFDIDVIAKAIEDAGELTLKIKDDNV